MKNILFILALFFSVSTLYSQSKQEAIAFLKLQTFEWSCPNSKYPVGSSTPRLNISLEENGDLSYLYFQVKRDEDIMTSGWFVTKIYLSKIQRFSITNESSDCRKLLIHTEVNGIETSLIDNNGITTMSSIKMKEFYEQMGWKNDNILLYGNKERNDRMIKALTFLAKEYGAVINKSNF